MIVGEDRNKIRNIVLPNLPHFSELYKPYIDSFLEESADGLLYRVWYLSGADTGLLGGWHCTDSC